MSAIYVADPSQPDHAARSIKDQADAYVEAMKKSAERINLVSESVNRSPDRVIGKTVELLLGVVGVKSVLVLKEHCKVTLELDLNGSDGCTSGVHGHEHTDGEAA